jgi:predicted AAA+ superfamily ATPase
MQEKLSLSDRFGIRVVFPTPDQRRYLAVVESLASQRGLSLEPDILRRRGLQWADWHNGRSGRTARQFIDHLAGELGVASRAEG